MRRGAPGWGWEPVGAGVVVKAGDSADGLAEGFDEGNNRTTRGKDRPRVWALSAGVFVTRFMTLDKS